MKNLATAITWLVLGACLLAGCQAHLPPLETSPTYPGPKIGDVIDHINCELAGIVADTPTNMRLKDRVAADKNLAGLLPDLTTYHFVATAQLSLEVTDAEGFNPSLSFINNSASLALGLGGQLTGSQDRSLTINYAVDLAQLKTTDATAHYCSADSANQSGRSTNAKLMADAGLNGAMAGDLGLADIVADGLTALDRTASNNIYSSTGPTPPVASRSLQLQANVTVPASGAGTSAVPAKTFVLNFTGTALFTPQSAGTTTMGSVTITGVATISAGGVQGTYMANWTGSMLPLDSTMDTNAFFSVSGTLMPAGSKGLQAFADAFGFSPTVTLTGTINKAADVFAQADGTKRGAFDTDTLNLAGTLVAAQGSPAGSTPLVLTKRAPVGAEHGPAGSSSGPAAKGGSASAASAGGTSFGSLVNFSVVAGLNGGPSWTFKKFKGPTGTNPLLSVTRTNTDALSITFVAACQDARDVNLAATNYWNGIGACDQVGTAQQLSAGVGYENNSLMILRNLIVRPAGSQ